MSNNGKIKVTKKTPHSMYGNVLNTYRQEEIIKTWTCKLIPPQKLELELTHFSIKSDVSH